MAHWAMQKSFSGGSFGPEKKVHLIVIMTIGEILTKKGNIMKKTSFMLAITIALDMLSSAVHAQEMTHHNDSTATRANIDSSGDMTAGRMGGMHNFGLWSSGRKDPATAALLSIQPLPFDFGGFYAGNWQRGIIYTTAELGLFIPAMVLLSQNWNHMDYYYPYAGYPGYYRSWSTGERNTFYVLVGSYVLVKLVAAFDAGYSVQRASEKISVGFDRKERSVSLRLAIAIR